MQFVRASALVLVGLISAVSFAGFTPSFVIDNSATNGQFESKVDGDTGAGSFDALSNPDPLSFNAFSGAVAGGNSTFTNGTTAFNDSGFTVNAHYSFDGNGSGYSNFSVRGGIIATEISDFAVNYAPYTGLGVSKIFVNGLEINNPEGQTYTGRLNVGDKLELLVTGNVTGPGNLVGDRGMYAEVCAVPVPEPATLAALGGGVALLARRRRQRSK
jgi:hypothetical protein